MKFEERLKTFRPPNWQASKPKKGEQLALMVNPKLITVEGRPCGILDGVAAAMLLQGLESNRILCAVNDALREMALAMKANDIAALKPMLFDLVEDGTSVLHHAARHIDQSYDLVDAARRDHDAAVGEPEVTH